MMEHGRFAYSPIAKRAPLKLPDGARLAVWITPNIEHFHYGQPAISLTPMTANLKPDVLNYAWRDYGVRVGIWRLMEIFEKYSIPCTAALNSDVCLHYPEIVAEGNRLGWEWMAHGRSNSELISGQTEAEERTLIKEALDVIARHAGKASRGWLGPALCETDRTLDILAEAGVRYVADWCNDDQPYRMKVKAGSMVAMPYTLEVGDIPVFLEQGGTAEDFYQLLVDQFDQLYEEGAKTARIMSVAIHPFLVGHPYRARHFARALDYMRKRDGVWFATGSQILDWFDAAVPA
jgi:peptidoglycan/xylan/chitin deacetylase (PgdA/CDA1 family)